MLPYLKELIEFYKCLTNYEFCQIEDAIYIVEYNLNYTFKKLMNETYNVQPLNYVKK